MFLIIAEFFFVIHVFGEFLVKVVEKLLELVVGVLAKEESQERIELLRIQLACLIIDEIVCITQIEYALVQVLACSQLFFGKLEILDDFTFFEMAYYLF